MWNIFDKEAIPVGLYNTSNHTYVKIDYDDDLHDQIVTEFETTRIENIDAARIVLIPD